MFLVYAPSLQEVDTSVKSYTVSQVQLLQSESATPASLVSPQNSQLNMQIGGNEGLSADERSSCQLLFHTLMSDQYVISVVICGAITS